MKLSKKQDDYFACIIHDLKTPAIAQIQALQSLARSIEKKISSEEADLLKLTLNSCSYTRKLIDTFSIVNRLDYEKLKLTYEKFNLIDLVDEIIDEFKILFKYHNLKTDFNKKGEIIVCADKKYIRTVVENIISSSINQAFCDSCISINVKKSKKDINFEIKYLSPFIEPEVLKEIFERKKVKTSSFSPVGVALGLYLSREIINAHFGKMIAGKCGENTIMLGFSLPVQ